MSTRFKTPSIAHANANLNARLMPMPASLHASHASDSLLPFECWSSAQVSWTGQQHALTESWHRRLIFGKNCECCPSRTKMKGSAELAFEDAGGVQGGYKSTAFASRSATPPRPPGPTTAASGDAKQVACVRKRRATNVTGSESEAVHGVSKWLVVNNVCNDDDDLRCTLKSLMTQADHRSALDIRALHSQRYE